VRLAACVSDRFRTVSFLSDFGAVDEFVGVCHAVIADIAPDVRIIDLAHQIPPHDIRAGALALARAVAYVPRGVILAVVDPGVGTARRAVAVEVASGEGVFVGPDNGLLAHAVALTGGAERAVELTNDAFHLAAPGPTFAGRDVFAPVAAHLCLGVDLSELGPEIDTATMLPGIVPLPRVEGEDIVAEVLWVDRYGNAQLNVDPDEIVEWGDVVSIRFDGNVRTAQRVVTYDEIGSRVGLLADAHGLLAICLARRSAADELALGSGTEVRLVRLDRDGDSGGGDGDGGAFAQPPVSTPVQLAPRR